MKPELSLVLPVYEEVESLPLLWEELQAVLAEVGMASEVIFVDDGSTDGSALVVAELAESDKRVRLLRLGAHSGLSAAFYAGFQAARGELIASMDADLQSDPGDLARLLARVDSADAVLGVRGTRMDPWLKRASSRIANTIRTLVLGDRVADTACSLRVMHRRCLAALLPFEGMHRFVPTLLRMGGFSAVEVPVVHRPRRFGRSKFGVRNRALRGFVDLLAVRWMLQRHLRFEVREAGSEQ